MEEELSFTCGNTEMRVFESRGLNGQEQRVEHLKKAAAFLLAEINKISIPPGNSEAGRLVSIAKTELETCVMYAVKAYSRNH